MFTRSTVCLTKRLPCFTLANVREKIKEGQNPRSHTYKSYKHTTITANPPTSPEDKPTQRRRTKGGQHHQVHNMRASLGQHLPEGKTQLKTCRRHPNATTDQSNFDFERRYYLNDATPSMLMKCNVHTRNLAKSLNELYEEPARTPATPTAAAAATLTAAPPPPSTIKAGTAQTLPRQLQQSPTVARFADLPQEFPLTRSVSTTTEIFQNNNEYGGLQESGRSAATPHFERRNRRNMATNTQAARPTDTEVTRNECSDTRQLATNRRRQPSEVRHIDAQRNGNHVANDKDDDEVDDELFDDEEPQRLCGLKRGIRKTKDELFQEFCKRAGVRPKPKNIYYIANEEETLRRKRQSGDLAGGNASKLNGGLRTLVDDLEYVEEDDGFKQLDAHNERIYGNDAAYQVRNMRRASMFVEPTHLRKLNSNLSLHTLYPTDNRNAAPNAGFYDTIRTEVPNELWPAYPEPLRSAYGGSQSRLDSNTQLNQSRATLPRSFLRNNNADSQDSIASASLQALHNAYSASQTRLTNLMLHPQQQQQQQILLPQDGLVPLSQGAVGYLHKSYDDLNATSQLTDPAQKPINGNTLQQPVIQWPTAIPSSPSNFGGNYAIYGATPARAHHAPSIQHALVTRSSSGGGSGVGVNGQAKFQRAYAFDEQRRSSAATDAFDLDEMERERRRSHASLFNGVVPVVMQTFSANNTAKGIGDHYDLVNGTAV